MASLSSLKLIHCAVIVTILTPTPTTVPQTKANHLNISFKAGSLVLGVCFPLSLSATAKYQIHILFFHALLLPLLYPKRPHLSSRTHQIFPFDSLRHNPKAVPLYEVFKFFCLAYALRLLCWILCLASHTSCLCLAYTHSTMRFL